MVKVRRAPTELSLSSEGQLVATSNDRSWVWEAESKDLTNLPPSGTIKALASVPVLKYISIAG